MPIQTIPAEALFSPRPAQIREWCSLLEAGGILYFPQTPVPLPAEDLAFLLRQQQTGSALHKNIAYKPERNQLSGVDNKTATQDELDHLSEVMRRYSNSVVEFLSRFLAPYQRQWQLDYASFRPIEEQGRDLSLRRRNDLLHTDAFPTRPTHGARILRFFNNIHPNRTRDWAVTEPFARTVGQFTPSKIALPKPDGALVNVGKRLAVAAGLGKLLPQSKRSPYDAFMMELHNAMKADANFQENCVKEFISFAPGSSWMAYTETLPHSVLAGQFALEQTLLVEPQAMTTPESTPLAILEKLAGAKLA